MSLQRLKSQIAILISFCALIICASNMYAQQNMLDSLEAAHRSRPNDPKILYDLGTAYYYMEKHAEAAAAYEKVIELAPEHPGTYFSLGYSYHAMGRDNDAVSMALKGAGMMGEKAEAYSALGEIFGKMKMYDSALVAYQKGLVLAPNNLEIMEGVALAASVLRKIPEAIETWSAIARMTPNEYQPHFMLGMLYSYSKNYKQGIAPLKKALSLEQTSDAYEILGACHGELREYKEALAAYQQGIKLDPVHPGMRYNLGRCHVNLNDLDKGIQEFREAIRLDSSLTEVYLDLAIAHARRSEFKEGLRIAQIGVEKHPDFAELHKALAGLYAELDDMEGARKELDILRKLDPAQAKKAEEQLKTIGKKP